MGVRENKYQAGLIKRLTARFPHCMILKNDSSYLQGVPDLIVLDGDLWAMLEVTASAKASHQPNQDYYVEKLDHMGFARFVYPENETAVLNELDAYFRQDYL